MQGIDEFDLLPVYRDEAGIQVHDAAEDRHGHASDDDGRRGGAQPYDEQRCKRRFRQAVQDDKIGLQYLGQFPAAPQEDGDQDAEQCDQQKTDDGLIQCDPDMQEDRTVQYHFPEAQGNPGRTAEDKGVNDPCIGTDFPQEQKEDKDQHPCSPHDQAVAAELDKEQFLTARYFIHCDSAPSRFR